MNKAYLLLVIIILFFLFLLIKNVFTYKKYGEFKTDNLNKLSRILANGNFDQAEKLFNSKEYNLNEVNNKGKTLLYLFAHYKNYEGFKWVLEKGADPNLLLFSDKEDSVMRAVAECNDSKFLTIALRNGGDPLLVHRGGYRPLYFACVLDKQVNVDILISAGDNGNVADEYRNTTFTCLIILNKYDKVSMLLNKGLNPFKSSQEIRDSIVYYVEMSNPSLAKELMPHYLKVVEKLRGLGFKIELLNLQEFMQRDEDRRKAGWKRTPENP